LLARQLEMSGDGEVTSKDIGKRVMEMLARLDPVAFVRYASVYNDFQQASDFTRLLESLGGRAGKEDG
jgi:transcriptional repressor NrdR